MSRTFVKCLHPAWWPEWSSTTHHPYRDVWPLRVPCAAFLLAILLGCSERAAPWHGGEVASTFGQRADTTAVLILDPGQCLACNQAIAKWRNWEARAQEASFVVLFSRPASTHEAPWLRSARVFPDSVLGDSSLIGFPKDPELYLVIGGVVVDSGVGPTGANDVLARLEEASGGYGRE